MQDNMFYNLKGVSVRELFYTECIFNECLLYHLFISTHSVLQRSFSTLFWGKKTFCRRLHSIILQSFLSLYSFHLFLSLIPFLFQNLSVKQKACIKMCNSHFDWKASILHVDLYYKMICLILANNLCSYKDLYGICFGFLLSRVSHTTFL